MLLVARIAPSILSADFANLAAEVARVAPQSDLLHVDVMDGHFVPNITLGPPIVKSLRAQTDLYFDCHLMISDPGAYLEAFKKAGADSCSIHLEVGNTAALIAEMRALQLDVGLGVNPDTPLEAFEEFIPHIDMLLVMTVVPGFGGQKFMEEVMPKLRASRALADTVNPGLHIEVDGGIDVQTGPVAAQNGADTFVAGNAIFAQSDPLAAAEQLREAITAFTKAREEAQSA